MDQNCLLQAAVVTHTWNIKKNVIFEKKNQESSHQTMYSLPHDPFGSLQIIFLYLWLEIQVDKIIRSLTHRLLRQEDRKLAASLGCRLRLSQKKKKSQKTSQIAVALRLFQR